MTNNLRKSMARLVCIWTLLLGAIYGVLVYLHTADTLSEAVDEARHYYTLNLHYRAWNSQLGGLYASTAKIAPNPYLSHPKRDITMPDGTEYTLVNPAYMTRMVFDAIRNKPGLQVISKITSLNALNPANAPDPWEREALQAFDRGHAREMSEKTVIDSKPYLRFIAPFMTEGDCLTCHAHQGYKVGDIRGGISIAIPLEHYLAANSAMKTNLAGGFTMLWLLGCSGIVVTGRKHILQAEEVNRYRDQILEQLRESKRAEEALRDSNERFQRAFDNAPTIMAITSMEDGRCLDINQRFLDISGFTREEVIGRTFVELGWITREEREGLLRELHESGGVNNRELTHRTKTGKNIFLNYSGQVIPFDGGKHLLSILQDMTEHRMIEQQLFQSQKMEAIGQLAGGIAHDFNNLLQAINSFAFLVQMQLKEHDLSVQFAEEIAKAGKRAAELTMGLLAFSRKQPINPKLTDVNRIIEDTHKLLSRVLAETITFSIAYHPSPLMVMADAGQIQQVLINLATNARDAMPAGGALTIVTGRSTMDDTFIEQHGYGARGSYATITVSDTGYGMGNETKDHIFEPFFTTKEQGKGTGLGLSIVYGIVKQHNGYITVASNPGAGTTFRIYLQEVTEDQPYGGHEAEVDPVPQGSETILVVDDEEMVRMALGSILAFHGYRVIEASSGQEAIDLFRARSHEIMLVVTDMVMPHMSGDKALRDMRTVRPDLPALFISGYTEENSQIHTQLDGQTALLMKPITPVEILRTIRELIDRNRGSRMQS